MGNIKKTVVVVGGGFGGVNFIKELSKQNDFNIILVDLNNYHFFPPLLYQVSTAFIEPSNISYPFRRMFREKDNVRFFLGEFQSVNTNLKTIQTSTGELAYDYLVIGMGTESNYFGMENVKNNSLPMKNINEALNLRNTLLLNLEKAVKEPDTNLKQRLLNIVIAGGGPTGVEIAGMLAQMGGEITKKEYPEIKNFNRNIYLVDAASTLLGPMSKKSQEEAYKVLSNLGVKIILNVAVKDYLNGEVVLSNDEKISTSTLIWSSGVIGREIVGIPSESVGRGRRLLVDEFNRVKNTHDIFAIGDISLQQTDSNFPNGHPQLAQVAIQQGIMLAKNLPKLDKSQTLNAFKYNDKGSMAIISKFNAVVDLPKMFFHGFFAWLMWLIIHLIPIAGFRNKVRLFFSWVWSFITNDPTLRLIIRPKKDD